MQRIYPSSCMMRKVYPSPGLVLHALNLYFHPRSSSRTVAITYRCDLGAKLHIKRQHDLQTACPNIGPLWANTDKSKKLPDGSNAKRKSTKLSLSVLFLEFLLTHPACWLQSLRCNTTYLVHPKMTVMKFFHWLLLPTMTSLRLHSRIRMQTQSRMTTTTLNSETFAINPLGCTNTVSTKRRLCVSKCSACLLRIERHFIG